VARFMVASGQMVMVTGVSFPPRARVCAGSIQGIMLSQKIAAPPRKGRRSELWRAPTVAVHDGVRCGRATVDAKEK
jgi:hypothetical protein